MVHHNFPMLPIPSCKGEVSVQPEELDVIRVTSVGQMTPNSLTGTAQGRIQRAEEGGEFLEHAVVRKRNHPVNRCDWLARRTNPNRRGDIPSPFYFAGPVPVAFSLLSRLLLCDVFDPIQFFQVAILRPQCCSTNAGGRVDNRIRQRKFCLQTEAGG